MKYVFALLVLLTATAWANAGESECTGGRSWTGQECICPPAQKWNGQQCMPIEVKYTILIFKGDKLIQRYEQLGSYQKPVEIVNVKNVPFVEHCTIIHPSMEKRQDLAMAKIGTDIRLWISDVRSGQVKTSYQIERTELLGMERSRNSSDCDTDLPHVKSVKADGAQYVSTSSPIVVTNQDTKITVTASF